MTAGTQKKKDFLTLVDYTSEELKAMLDLADKMKARPQDYREALKGQSLGMIFAKNSTRTRISFQVGIYQLGGEGLFFGQNDLQLSRGETIHDTAKVLSRYLDGIMIRTYAYQDVLDLAKYASIPIINGLTDYNHPCQVMADLMTIREKFGKTKGLKMTYVGDGNNMTVSLMFGCIRFGMDFASVSPKNYTLSPEIIAHGQKLAKEANVKLTFTENLEEGLAGTNVVYGDTWTSMGQEAEAKKRLHDFQGYQVNSRVMQMASKDAIYMHCLPAHRNEEVTDEVLDGKQSVIFDEAENRLHAQKAIMYTLMKK